MVRADASLLIIDDKRQAFAYFPERRHPAADVRGVDSIGRSSTRSPASGGNLYVLDVKQNQVWRYLPGPGRLRQRAHGLLDQADLTNATELAVGQDVYRPRRKAGIRRFRQGRDAVPDRRHRYADGVARSISVLPGSNRIVVADRGNKRIIVASQDGAFLRQIVSPSFTDLRAVSVDEGKGILYVLNGDTLLKGGFPP